MGLPAALKDRANEAMSEDGVVDDDQPDREGDYLQMELESVEDKELLEWAFGDGVESVKASLKYLKEKDTIEEFLLEVLYDAASNA